MKITADNFIGQLRVHNEKALVYVVEEYGGLITSIVRKHLYAMPDSQEECFNDILLNVWNHIDSFNEIKNSFKNWIAGIARYRSIDYLRKYKRDLDNVSWDDIVVAKEDANLIQLVDQEISEELEMMLSCLKPEDQELFMKLYVEELDVNEVSRDMCMDKDVIYNRVSRGKRKMRNQSAKTKRSVY